MTDSNYTHVVAVVDRSGSMWGIANDMVGALNAFFAENAKADGKTLVDYVQFDHISEMVFEDRPAYAAKAELEPRGSTALLDAVGFAVANLGKKLAGMDEDKRPGLVQVVVVTDGYENSSREWTAKEIKALVKQQEDVYNWDFVFLGANMDAVAVGEGFGFKADKSLTYDVHNTGAMSAALTTYGARSRSVGSVSNAFTSEERDAQKA